MPISRRNELNRNELVRERQRHRFAKLVQSHEDTLLPDRYFTIPPPY